MDYLLLKMWPYVLLALMMGGVWGYYTCPTRDIRWEKE
jgi:hypothetical protein